jgi:phosphoribosyl-ATP pyrophosphohydrolase
MECLAELYAVLRDRKDNPKEGSYTNALLDDPEKAYRKLNEETYEVIHACLAGDRAGVVYEAGDLIYHLMAVLVKHGVGWDEILAELKKRRR